MNQQKAQRVSSLVTTLALAMPEQRLDVRFTDPAAPTPAQSAIRLSPVMVLLSPALLCVIVLFLPLKPLQSAAKPTLGPLFLCGIVIVRFFLDAVAAAMAIAELIWKSRPCTSPVQPLRMSILVLLFGAPPEPVITRAARLLASYDGQGIHSFSLHVLSGSRQCHSALRGPAAFEMARRRHGHHDIWHLHRESNTDFKSGNITNWKRPAGHFFDAMLVLDADSVMDVQSICAIADALWTTVSLPPASGFLVLPLMLIALVLLVPHTCSLISTASKLPVRDLAYAIQEFIFSSLLAPILMVQRTIMIISIILGGASVWDKPKNDQMSLRSAPRFLGVEVGLAAILLTGWLVGYASPLILTVALPLLLAPILSQAVTKLHAKPIWSPLHETQ